MWASPHPKSQTGPLRQNRANIKSRLARGERTQGLQGGTGTEGTAWGQQLPGLGDGHGEGRQGGHRETEGKAGIIQGIQFPKIVKMMSKSD